MMFEFVLLCLVGFCIFCAVTCCAAASESANRKNIEFVNKKANDPVMRSFELQVRILQDKIKRGIAVDDKELKKPWELQNKLTDSEYQENSRYMQDKWKEILDFKFSTETKSQ